MSSSRPDRRRAFRVRLRCRALVWVPPASVLAVCVFAAAVWTAGAAVAPPAAAARPASGLRVAILSPAAGEPVVGAIELLAQVTDPALVERLTFFLDGRALAHLTAPPFRLTVDVGEALVAHRIEVVARDRKGEETRDAVVTGSVQIDERLDLELLQLYVTVTRDGDRVTDLGRGEIAVLDDGREQQLVTFDRGDLPLTALLLVDASESMQGSRLTAALAGAEAFISAMRPLDQAKLLLHSDRILHTTPFTSFAEILTAGLAGVEAQGGTALTDHLYLGLKLLAPRQGRRVVILLSDGVDTASVLEMRALLPFLRRSEAMIYWLRLGDSDGQQVYTSAWRNGRQHARELTALERAVAGSGGRALPVRGSSEIAPAFAAILEELREQYALGFYPSHDRDDGRWHRLSVRVARPGVAVRTRAGYYDARR